MYRHDETTGTSSGCGCGGATTSRRPERPTKGQGCCGCSGCEPCDGLTCLCRPRFFDGQLVTAADFGRLDQYLVAKDRLHNRYLHGVGVVCGLEAVCNTCDDTVTVRRGYALGPCGEDIVVCADTRVDVAALVKEHRRSVSRVDCAPYSDPAQDCEAARQRWVLGICYDERPAKPVAALTSREPGCGCGGSGGGQCSPGRAGPSSCEPTQVCEGFRFTLTKVPPRTVDDTEQGGRLQGELPSRVLACLRSLQQRLTRIPADPSGDELVTYCCELKADLRELVEDGSVHDCTLSQRLHEIVCPDPHDEEAGTRARAAIAAMLHIAVDLFRSCVCSALLPPCGEDCADECVPLAVLTVRSSDLRVLDVCNWSARRFAVTMPALSYWLGWVPIFGAVRDAVERLCCDEVRRPAFGVDDDLRVSSARSVRSEEPAEEGDVAGRRPTAQTRTARAGDPTAFVRLAAQYAEGGSPLAGLEATVLGALGGRAAAGEELASPLELANPLAALSLARVGMPAGASLVPPDLPRRIRVERGEEAAAPPVTPDRVAALEETVAKLSRTVESQARAIRSLKGKGTGR